MQPALIRPERFSDIARPENVLAEVREIVWLIFPYFDFYQVNQAYQDTVRLFQGEYAGYQKCNTGYHDLRHTEDCLLTTARLIHGAFLHGNKFSPRGIQLGLISAVMHDTGYIQAVEDRNGTGAKYTLSHVERSIDFLEDYFMLKGYSFEDFLFCKKCLKCTGIKVEIKEIRFESRENEMMGKILGAADIIGQMADPHYLEKLPVLFKEYQEAGITEYESELDLLKKTPDFWEYTKQRFLYELGNVDQFLRDHFRVRWDIDQDLEREAIEHNISRLKAILANHPADYHKYLRP